jgi:hypothetical protein
MESHTVTTSTRGGWMASHRSRDFTSRRFVMTSKDKERLDKLTERLRRAIAVHTNPVEVGVNDLQWLLDIAKKHLEDNQ